MEQIALCLELFGPRNGLHRGLLFALLTQLSAVYPHLGDGIIHAPESVRIVFAGPAHPADIVEILPIAFMA